MKLAEIQSLIKAPKGQFNSFGKYKYRSCEDIVEAVKPVINPLGFALIISDDIVEIGGRVYVKATATLTDGKEVYGAVGYAREEESKKGMDGSQVTGAASSYARKYALNGLFAIDDTKDSDNTNDHRKKQEIKKETKEVLTESHPSFEQIVSLIASGKRTILQLKEKFIVTEAVEQIILQKLSV